MTATVPLQRPAHVPRDRVFDYDHYNLQVSDAEYQLAVAKLQASGVPEILWTPHNGGHWVVTRAGDIKTVLNDWRTFSSRALEVPKPPPDAPGFIPLQIDPPDHSKYRALLAPAMSPAAIEILAKTARKLAIDLVEGMKPRGECELVGEFAQHLPIAIFMQMVGLPDSDRLMLTRLCDLKMRSESEAVRNSAGEDLVAYSRQKVKERRANPGTDLISRIATARIDGEMLNDYDVTAMLLLLLVAGLDTVAATLGFFAHFLALNPGHRKALRDDPSLIPTAVEEMLRRFAVSTTAREVAQDVEFGGVRLKVGDMVVVPLSLYGLDDRLFAAPAEVDYQRTGVVHATFGGGVHRCMGSMLARTELRIFLEEWLPRIPDFAVAPGAHLVVKARSVATIECLPLVWN